ncbi:protein of unknown function DUF669 [Rhizobium phage RHph_X2_26]|nr:protein of unknown function DUF669 [Rhizobium phage RHph_X2_26]
MGAFEYRRSSTREEIEYKGGLIPNGKYRLIIDAAKMEKNSKGSGEHLALTYKVLEPERYAGRLIFNNVNAWHENEKTRDGAQKEMDRILEAIGFEGDPGHTDDFMMQEFNAYVGEERPNPNAAPDPNWRPRNRVVRYYFPDEDFEPGIDEQQPQRSQGGARGGNGRGRDDGASRDRDRERVQSSRDAVRGRDERRERDSGRGRDDDRRRDERDERSRENSRDRGRDDRGGYDDDIPFDGRRDERRSDEGNGDGERHDTANGSRKPWGKNRS